MSNIETIGAAIEAVQEKHAEYTPLHAAYLKAMSTAGGYEMVPGADEKRAEVALSMIADGELTSKGIARAVESKLIQKITVKKSPELLAAEESLLAAHREYDRLCRDAVLPYQVKATKACRGSSGEGKVGQDVIDRARSITLQYDEGAEFTFEGRQMTVTFSNGKVESANVYNAVFGHGDIPEKFHKAIGA